MCRSAQITGGSSICTTGACLGCMDTAYVASQLGARRRERLCCLDHSANTLCVEHLPILPYPKIPIARTCVAQFGEVLDANWIAFVKGPCSKGGGDAVLCCCCCCCTLEAFNLRDATKPRLAASLSRLRPTSFNLSQPGVTKNI